MQNCGDNAVSVLVALLISSLMSLSTGAAIITFRFDAGFVLV